LAQPGEYKYRIAFDLTGFDPKSTVVKGRWTSDNVGVAVLLNGAATGVSNDGNFGAFSRDFVIQTGFIAGRNVLEFVVSNAAPNGPQNPTGFRAEVSGKAKRL
jgi:hypothetical protein